jgi:hypothetical protein
VLALTLLLASAFYVFWSRAFLIESTALFFSLAYLATVWAFLDRPRWAVFLLALSLGVLAALVKITTCAGAWLALGLLLPTFLRGPGGWRRALAWLVLVGVPIAAGFLWTAYADGLKEQNPFARHLTSHALREWNFGTWDERWRWETWGGIFFRATVMAGQTILLGCSLLLALLARRRRAAVAGCALIYVTLPLVFTNLYVVHEYYAYASMVFLVGGVALAVTGLSERGGRWARAGRLLAVAFLVVAGYDYLERYYPIQSANHTESAAVCRAVRERTDPDEVILVLGCDWSSEVPYYSRRRALMVPSWKSTPLEDLPLYLERLRGWRVGALVIRRAAVSDEELAGVLRDLEAWGLAAEPGFRGEVYSLYTLTPARRARAGRSA